jgi:hypothetical protein
MRLLRKMLAHYRMLRFFAVGAVAIRKSDHSFWNLYVGGRNLER